VLAPEASVFVTDTTYASVRIEVDAPTGEPAYVVLRDDVGVELEVGGPACPLSGGAGAPSTIVVERSGGRVTARAGGGPPRACAFRADGRVSIGLRGAAGNARSVARKLRVTRI
jgi:hypothetical protein